MAQGPGAEKSKYLYAVIDSAEDRVFGAIGLDGGTVYSLSDGRIAAVVGDIPNQKIRPERKHLAAHREVLRLLMQETTPLPMSFGIIARNAGEILRILRTNRASLQQQLEHVAGKVEMGLRVTWDVGNIFEYFVNTHPDLRIARDELMGRHREPTHEDKLELGRMFERLHQSDRESLTDTVEDVLTPRCFEIRRNPPRQTEEVMNLACLVAKDGREGLEAAVLEAAQHFDNNFTFDYNGPWAPHNFVDIHLTLKAS
jgi:hypothetical protein